MRHTRRTLAAAALALALAAAPADAGELILVGGGRAERVNDPALPARAELDLPMPGAVASAAAARTDRARSPRIAAASSRRGRRAVLRALRRSDEERARVWRRSYIRSLRELRRLRGARDTQLRYVVGSVEALALSRRLSASRMPAAFLQLERNRQYWRRYPFPASRDQVSFRGSQIVFTYFPGEGLQLHPLTTFKKANALHGFCEREEPGCDRAALEDLLDEMTGLAVRRSRRFIAWEYMFHFGGGSPPWMSGMAQATALQAYARAARLLDKPEYVQTARRGLGAFETRPPTGVRTTGPGGGVHYLQYSFSPRLYIFNAFLQSLIGLHDFGKLTGDKRARELFREAEPEARAEVPLSDVGDWSRYSYAGAESTRDYHELLREFLQSMCSRRLGRLYCDYARRYRGYQVDPPELELLGPATATADEPVAIRFSLSKLSAVELKIYRGERLVHSALASFRLGTHAFTWTPAVPGTVRVELAAKELRTGLGKKDRAAGQIEIDP
ncbi:MAG TPA: D-glucuronyl C5-epimerase family protein [Thermoleophilaceae bacterium]|nr:D-glucuronyl C5-epimerase family protein [Thermoleophilaceae bacterium]